MFNESFESSQSGNSIITYLLKTDDEKKLSQGLIGKRNLLSSIIEIWNIVSFVECNSLFQKLYFEWQIHSKELTRERSQVFIRDMW